MVSMIFNHERNSRITKEKSEQISNTLMITMTARRAERTTTAGKESRKKVAISVRKVCRESTPRNKLEATTRKK